MDTAEQLDLLATSGNTLQSEGTRRVLATEDEHGPDYREAALAAIDVLIERGAPFTADDVHPLIPEGLEPHHHNVLPALMRSVSRTGRIEPDGWASSTRPQRHAGYSRRWRPTCGTGA